MTDCDEAWEELRQWARAFVAHHRLRAGDFFAHYCRLPDVDARRKASYSGYSMWLSCGRRAPSTRPGTRGRQFRAALRALRRADAHNQVPRDVLSVADAVQAFWRQEGDRFAADGVVHAEFDRWEQALVLHVLEGGDTPLLHARLTDALGQSPHRLWFDALCVRYEPRLFLA